MAQNVHCFILDFAIEYREILFCGIACGFCKNLNYLVIDNIVILVDLHQVALIHSLTDQYERICVKYLYGLCLQGKWELRYEFLIQV